MSTHNPNNGNKDVSCCYSKAGEKCATFFYYFKPTNSRKRIHHGDKYKELCKRLLWILSLLVCAGALIYQLYVTTEYYFINPVYNRELIKEGAASSSVKTPAQMSGCHAVMNTCKTNGTSHEIIKQENEKIKIIPGNDFTGRDELDTSKPHYRKKRQVDPKTLISGPWIGTYACSKSYFTMFMECEQMKQSGAADPEAKTTITLVKGLEKADAPTDPVDNPIIIYYQESADMVVTTKGSFKANNLELVEIEVLTGSVDVDTKILTATIGGSSCGGNNEVLLEDVENSQICPQSCSVENGPCSTTRQHCAHSAIPTLLPGTWRGDYHCETSTLELEFVVGDSIGDHTYLAGIRLMDPVNSNTMAVNTTLYMFGNKIVVAIAELSGNSDSETLLPSMNGVIKVSNVTSSNGTISGSLVIHQSSTAYCGSVSTFSLTKYSGHAYFWRPGEVFNVCAINPCQNNGSCEAADEGTKYSCSCKDGYSGTQCEQQEVGGGQGGDGDGDGDDDSPDDTKNTDSWKDFLKKWGYYIAIAAACFVLAASLGIVLLRKYMRYRIRRKYTFPELGAFGQTL